MGRGPRQCLTGQRNVDPHLKIRHFFVKKRFKRNSSDLHLWTFPALDPVNIRFMSRNHYNISLHKDFYLLVVELQIQDTKRLQLSRDCSLLQHSVSYAGLLIIGSQKLEMRYYLQDND